MASVWCQKAPAPEGDAGSTTWEPVPLRFRSEPGAVRSSVRIDDLAFLEFGPATEREIVLIVPVGVRAFVNGLPVPGGLRVLAHGHEILAAGKRYSFSDESLPVVAVFRVGAGERTPTCPVCRGPIKDGENAVRCPRCSHWFYQVDGAEGKPAKPCWTYAESCRICSHPTSLSGDSVWRPDMEEAHHG